MLFFPFTRFKSAPRDISLTIHPLVTLEDWVGAVHFALIDDALSEADQERLLDLITEDPDAQALFRQAIDDEAMISACFSAMSAAPGEPALSS